MNYQTYRVIDANYNRAKEGLRVVEDISRFILERADLTAELKELRSQLDKLINPLDKALILARDSAEDAARSREVPRRKSIKQRLLANFKRAEEALRVLEEFCSMGTALKDLRYRCYDLEKTIYLALRVKVPLERDLYVISDVVDKLRTAVSAGAGIIQLRDKSGDLKLIEQKALELVKFVEEKSAIFILNDYPELALRIKADGVHLGQDYGPLAKLREQAGENFIIGRTTHNLEQGKAAEKEGANYISVGPVFATPTKPGRTPVGLEYVRLAAGNLKIPFVAIGGINLGNVDEVLAAGARSIGIVRATEEIEKLLVKINNQQSEEPDAG